MQVLRERGHARVDVGDVLGDREVGRLALERHAGDLVRRRSGSRTRSGGPAGASGSAPALAALSSAVDEPRQHADRHVVGVRRLEARAGARRVRVVGVAAGRQLAAGLRLAVLGVQAQHPAQERERVHDVRVAARRRLADQDRVLARWRASSAARRRPPGRACGRASARPACRCLYCGLRNCGWLGSFQIDHVLTASP